MRTPKDQELALSMQRKSSEKIHAKLHQSQIYHLLRTDNGEKIFEFSNYDAKIMNFNFKDDLN